MPRWILHLSFGDGDIMHGLDYGIIFFVYFCIIFVIGYLASRQTNNTADFVLGGRRLGRWIVALGAGASDMSGWLMLGLPGGVYALGLSQIWMPIGLIIGAALNWGIVAKRLRIYTQEAKNSLTIPAFFENRFHDTSGLLRLVTSLAIIIFFTLYVSAGFVGGAVLFQSTFNLSYPIALSIGAVVIIAYTCLGGFLAVNWIDLFQGTLMWLALMVVPCMTLWSLIHQHGVNSSSLLTNQFSFFSQHSLSTIAIISLLAWGLGYFGQPHILVRFMAAKNPKDIRQSAWICMSWMTLSLIGAVLTGFLGYLYFLNRPLVNPETVFLVLSKTLFTPLCAGILLAAVLSVIMSAIAAQLLASSSALMEDLYMRFVRQEKDGHQGILWNRIAIIIIAGIALFLARNPDSRVLAMVGYAWAGLGASFGPLMLFSLFWSRTTRNAGIAGIIIGGATVLIWKHYAYLGGLFALYELIPGFILGGFTIGLVSLLGKPPADSIRAEFEKVRQLSHDKTH